MVKKYGDDQAGYLAALITYYSFLAIFPLLLVLVTLLTLVAGGARPSTTMSCTPPWPSFPSSERSFPTSTAFAAGSVLGLVIGLIGLVWGSLGASQAGIYAMAQVWNVPLVDRPGFVQRLGRSLTFLLLLGLFVALSTALDGIATSGGSTPMAIRGSGYRGFGGRERGALRDGVSNPHPFTG